MKRLFLMLLLAALCGCKAVDTTVSQPEVAVLRVWVSGDDTAVRAAAEDFDGATVEVQTVTAADSDRVVLRAVSAGKEPPDLLIFHAEALDVIREVAADLTQESWAQTLPATLLTEVREGGTVYALPLDVVGYGLAYSPARLAARGISPENINSLDRLAAVAAREEGAFAYAPNADEITGLFLPHFAFAHLSSAALLDAPRGETLFPLLDLIKQHGVAVDDPLEAVKNGDALFAPAVHTALDGDLALIPLPLPGGAQGSLTVRVARYAAVNKNSDPTVQNAARAFLKKLVPTPDPTLAPYVQSGRVLPAATARLDNTKRVAFADAIVGYLGGAKTQAEVLEALGK